MIVKKNIDETIKPLLIMDFVWDAAGLGLIAILIAIAAIGSKIIAIS